MTDQQETPQDDLDEVPEGALVVRPVPMAWLLASMTWLLVIGAFLMLSIVGVPIVDEITATLIAVVVMVPRFVGQRKTVYTLTDDTLIYQQGGIFGVRRSPIPMSSIKDVRARYGFFGRSLGYQSVEVMLANGAVARMPYLPLVVDVEGRIRSLMGGADATPDDAPESESADDQGPSS
jgi:membrane protein YdbS with pleckstrin-like domain